MRVAEVEVRVAVVVAQRRGGHAELIRGLEVFEDLPPATVVARAAAMALVHDDEVEEVRRERLEQPWPPLVLGERLVDGEVHLAALDDLAGLDLVPGIPERGEDAVLRLVHEDVAVGEIEDPRPPYSPVRFQRAFQSFQQIWKATAVLPVPVAIVRSSRRLPLRMRLDGAVDGDLLVVALALADRRD